MRKALLAFAALVAVLAPGTPAWAHTQLVSADPARQAVLAAAPTAITLEFSRRLNPSFTTIALSDAARRRVATSAVTVETVRATVAPSAPLGNGAYTVAYRVVSEDGHTVQGSYTFTVADPARPAAAAAPSAAAAQAGSASGSGGVPAGVLIGGGVLGLVLAAAAVFFVVSGRRKAVVLPATRTPAP
jgi:methionine-rich copper-binding protein CopC